MKVLLQRVSSASVTVEGEEVAAIGPGLLLLVGVAVDDTPETADALAAKVAALRVFPDDAGRFDRSALDTGAQILVVSQFTLLADTRRGRRPSFTDAAPPERARALLDHLAAALAARGLPVATGRFGAHMHVALVNDGPVTLMLEG